MRYCYFPGCTLKTKAKGFESSAFQAAEALGIVLEELPQWQCCGAVFPLSADELITLLSPVRSLHAASERGGNLVTLCAACHHVLKRANHLVQNDAQIREKVTGFLEVDYRGETRVIHFLELLRDQVGMEEIANRVTKSLEGRKLAPYYGCLLLRPRKEMQFDDPENPTILEKFITALGGEAVDYPFRTECCGGYLTVTEKGLAKETVGRVINSAARSGAEGLVVACPLCHYNLSVFQEDASPEIPVYYFTELLAEALGLKEGVEK